VAFCVFFTFTPQHSQALSTPNKTKTIPLEGESTFLQEQGEWRIQDDTYNMKEILDIVNKL